MQEFKQFTLHSPLCIKYLYYSSHTMMIILNRVQHDQEEQILVLFPAFVVLGTHVHFWYIKLEISHKMIHSHMYPKSPINLQSLAKVELKLYMLLKLVLLLIMLDIL